MPFKSTAQKGYMFKFHPDIAKRWAHEYGIPKNLPRHVGRRGRKRSSRLAHALASHTLKRKRRRRIRRVV